MKKHLQQKGLDLSPRPYAPQRVYSDKDLFDEMSRIWQKVGQRPSRNEWEMSEPTISITACKKRFGSWTNACQKFIEFTMGGEITSDNFVRFDGRDSLTHEKRLKYSKENSRNVSLSLRLNVLDRDNFRCVFLWKKYGHGFWNQTTYRSYHSILKRWKKFFKKIFRHFAKIAIWEKVIHKLRGKNNRFSILIIPTSSPSEATTRRPSYPRRGWVYSPGQ